ncbi:glucose-6-phosphate isomerase family protein [Methanosphaerula subterraneus]|uniref:glucose-6-phosphate isomerase family protein n=1 Tax=Methanosphaerula subterraneus TaxID=3350244 RepID=UPI003F865287
MKISWRGGHLPEPQVRTGEEMREVMADPNCSISGPLYTMYRDVTESDADRAWLQDHTLRYDITVIPAGTCGIEYAKTKGHYHPAGPGGVSYPEMYQVLEGRAHYLLQRKDLSDIVVVDASAGDMVLIPPEYGHVTINPVHETLVMANIVSTRFQSEYGIYEELKGGAYYEMEGGEFVKNPFYPAIPPLRRITPPSLEPLKIPTTGRLYDLIGNYPALEVLNAPEKFTAVLQNLLTD